jgi:hypothetical protein
MARPIKRLQAAPDVVKELRRRSRSTTIGARDMERANVILLRRDGAGVATAAGQSPTSGWPKAPKSSPKSSAPAPPSTTPRHELYAGN